MTNYYKSEYYKYPIEVDSIGGEVIMTITDNKGKKVIYSWYDLIAKNSESRYITQCILGGLIKNVPNNVLILGFGGGAFIKYLEDHIKNIKITGIDIDKTMLNIAKKEFKIKSKNLLIMDGKIAINKLIKENKKYDLILIDVYGSNGEIPKSFENKKIYNDIKKLIHTNGTLSINYADYKGVNIGKYDKIHSYLIDIFSDNFIHLLGKKSDKGNLSGVYNLDKKYTSIDVCLKYLEKIKYGEVLYDPNMIKNIIIDKN